MPTIRRTIRLFVSSTFSDMKAERDVLQADVFPRLRQLCQSSGLRFQPIDLRWGVPEEASKDNHTMRICLRELRRCQAERPKPNFLILLGNRYGWRPLPETIPANVFIQLRQRLSPAMRELSEWHESQSMDSKGWYRRDDNAVPPLYELRPRGDDPTWHETVEQPLLRAFEDAVAQIGLDARMHGVLIGPSAIEQEITRGAIEGENAREHVHAFFRTISGLPVEGWPKEYADVLEEGRRDTIAATRLDALKHLVEAKIGKENIHGYTVPWRGDGVHKSDLTVFGEEVYSILSGVIIAQIESLSSASPLIREEEAHRTFGDERCQGFTGHIEPLADIDSYIAGTDPGALILVGAPGSGKSALVANAVRLAREAHGEGAVIARFIGSTPESADVLLLLRNLVTEVRRRYPDARLGQEEPPPDGDIPTDIASVTSAFQEVLSRPTAERPLFLFLDAVDQLLPLHGALECYWLPSFTNPYVRLVLSASLSSEASSGIADIASPSGPSSPPQRDPRAVVIAALERHPSTVRRVHLQPLTGNDGRTIADQWLADAQRRLQPHQMVTVLTEFAKEGNPLWLRVALSEAQDLPSWAPPPKFNPQLPGLLSQVLDRLSEETGHGAVLVESALSAIASARYGLAEDEAMDVLSTDQRVILDFHRRSPSSPPHDTLPVAVWVRLLGDIALYVTERERNNMDLVWFYHRSFLEAVQAAYLYNDERRRTAHWRLASYFGGLSLRSISPALVPDPSLPNLKSINVRKLDELPWQQFHARQSVELGATLTDFEFALSKCEADLMSDLLADYRRAQLLPELMQMSQAHSWAIFLEESMPQLTQRDAHWSADRIFLQLALEHTVNSDIKQAAEQWLTGDRCDWLWIRQAGSPAAPRPSPLSGISVGDSVVELAVNSEGSRALMLTGRYVSYHNAVDRWTLVEVDLQAMEVVRVERISSSSWEPQLPRPLVEMLSEPAAPLVDFSIDNPTRTLARRAVEHAKYHIPELTRSWEPVAVLDGGARLITGTHDGMLRIWDRQALQQEDTDLVEDAEARRVLHDARQRYQTPQDLLELRLFATAGLHQRLERLGFDFRYNAADRATIDTWSLMNQGLQYIAFRFLSPTRIVLFRMNDGEPLASWIASSPLLEPEYDNILVTPTFVIRAVRHGNRLAVETSTGYAFFLTVMMRNRAVDLDNLDFSVEKNASRAT